MAITDELRKYATAHCHSWLCEKLLAIADSIDTELAERYVELPMDADGEYIHVGDVVTEHEDGHTFTVHGFMKWDGEWWVFQRDAIQAPARWCTHYHAPIVEDVLREFADECLTYATCVDDHEVTDAIEEYAAKLQLRGDAE